MAPPSIGAVMAFTRPQALARPASTATSWHFARPAFDPSFVTVYVTA